MGTILQFHQPDANRQSAEDVQAMLRKRGKASAEIIIFPGVRIEREPRPETSTAKAAPSKRAKKTARRKV